jgi:amino acid transporter
VFYMFVAILVLVSLVNIFSSHLLAIINNVSVWWHVVGSAAVIVILWVIPDNHASTSSVFTGTVNNTGGLYGGNASGPGFWLYVLPLGFLLTQYTITGYDASAHLSEETQAASSGAAKGIWRSIFYSGIGGWILLLSFLFAATNVEEINKQFGFVGAIFTTALSSPLATAIFAISTIGQFFCGMSCVTSMSRMTYAFSRDGAVPGWRLWSKVDRNRTPVNAIVAGCVVAALITLPALYAPPGSSTPVAFLAVVSIAVIGLYLAFLIPIWLRLRMGEKFVPGPWTLGRKYKVMCWIACVEIVIISIYFILPVAPAGVPGNKDFAWTSVNYAPLAVGVVLIGIALWWALSAKNWFTGPRRTIDEVPIN